ncbi:tRNA epoxyqueuosine(34) reductase QueG [Terricaulis silvestris]|uniref:Epoxyqueuosine reductase n=1 Tax=Terricaulis silvestris TaxID=2686094 RepID=A0A6I6MMI5_9CAUL|nr:tRNA epoxyqueuosine(34) reductase QueG [Terricaulis silvestris]QGZ93937.1 Epoxyqueuosine reductase [Terricaulis silvestris]
MLSSAALKAQARAFGFDAIGVADARDAWPNATWLDEFLSNNHQGEMSWMAQQQSSPVSGGGAERSEVEGRVNARSHPTALWSEAKSAILIGQSYAPADNSLALLNEKGGGLVSAYAARRDYHDVIKGKLKQLAQWLARETGQEVKVFVDTAPLMEKPLAQRAGLGWQGKHTNLVSREHGSWLFLGAILTAAELEPDAAEQDHCGSCHACLDICPTNAFPAPYQLDARKCLAYLTIESKSQIPREYREALGNRVFGCDDCLAICPWNKFAEQAREQRIALRDDLRLAPLEQLAALDDTQFRTRFAGTPVKRTGRDRFVRNVACAIGNSGKSELAPAAERLLDDSSPLVRGMAVWALRRLLDAEAFDRLKSSRAAEESEPDVRGEWDA